MLHDPVDERGIETNVATGDFAQEILVPQKFLALGEKLAVKLGLRFGV